MAQLIVRNLPEEIVRALKLRAARNNRSAEAEHREILRQTLLDAVSNETFVDFLMSMPDVGRDEDFERPRELPREPPF